jgi:hypothetical protein
MENENIEMKPAYEAPLVTVMSDDEVLKVFQMTCAQISAAGCWWNTSPQSH